MNARQIAIALAAAFPLIAITACDSQPESQRLSRATTDPEPPSYVREQAAPVAQLPMVLAQLDGNGDGKLSRSEAMNSDELERRFSELDRNRDEQLSASELEQAQAGAADGMRK